MTLQKYIVFNIHNSLLPKYRGLHAFSWALINGEREVGYTIHRAEKKLDSGDILSQLKIVVDEDDNIITVFSKASQLLEEWLPRQIAILEKKRYTLQIQDETIATYVCKRRKEDGLINWSDNALNIHNLIRALTPPYTDGAFTYWKCEPLYITKSEISDSPAYISIAGQVVVKQKDTGVLIKCGDKLLLVKEVRYKGEYVNAFDLFKTVGVRLG
jgi:methionyl-tRNA formyltransferase